MRIVYDHVQLLRRNLAERAFLVFGYVRFVFAIALRLIVEDSAMAVVLFLLYRMERYVVVAVQQAVKRLNLQ